MTPPLPHYRGRPFTLTVAPRVRAVLLGSWGSAGGIFARAGTRRRLRYSPLAPEEVQGRPGGGQPLVCRRNSPRVTPFVQRHQVDVVGGVVYHHQPAPKKSFVD